MSDLSRFDNEEAAARLLDALRAHSTGDTPEVIEARVRRVKRDRRLVQMLKELYAGKCQRCEFTFMKKDGTPYSEAAHIKPIADLLPGIDSPDNVVVLCANCHRTLDYGTLVIAWDEEAGGPVAKLEDTQTALALNKHIRMDWAPAGEWAAASKDDLEW